MVELTVAVAIVFHFMEITLALVAAHFIHFFNRRSKEYFAYKEGLPFFTLAMLSFAAAGFLDVIFLTYGKDVTLGLGLLVRISALFYLILGVRNLSKLLRG